MPDDKEIIATIKTQYDGTGAAEAKQDLSSLPEELRPIAESFAESQSQLDELSAAIGEANSALREHINSLSPAAAGYDQARQKATALRDQFVALYRNAERTSDSLSSTRQRLQDLEGSKKAIPNLEMEELSRRAAEARQEVAALREQMTALSAQRGGLTGGAEEALRAPTVPAGAVSSWGGLFNYIRRGAAGGAASITNMLRAAGGLVRLSAWGAVAKAALDGFGKTCDDISKKLGIAEDKSLTFGNVIKGLFMLPAEGAHIVFDRLVTSLISADNWAGKTIKTFHDVLGTLSHIATIDKEVEEAEERRAAIGERVAKQMQEEYAAAQKILQAGAGENFQAAIREELAARKEVYDERAAAAKEEEAEAARRAAAEEQAANRTLAATQRELELATARGDMTQEAAALELARAQEAHDTRLANLQAEQAARKAAAAEAAADLAKAYSEGMAGAMNNPEIAKWQPVLKVQLPDETELASIDARLKDQHAQLTEEAREQLIAEKSRILEQVDEVRRAVADLVPGLKPTGAQAVEMVRKMQQLNQAFEEGKLSAEQMAGNLSASAQKSREEADSAAQKSAEEKREAEAAREKAELQAAAAERAKGWERLEDASLSQQLGYVERMVSATKEGSDEWEQWSRQLRRLHNQAAAKELESIRRLGQDYGRSDDPAAQRAILRRQRQQLSQLAGRGGLSADLQEQIAREQASVRAAMQHWRAETQKAAAQGQQNLLGAKAPDLQATNKGMQGAVRRINTALEAQARQLERETREGDKQSMSRIGEKMVRLAAQAEKLTGYTGQYADMVNKLKDSARAQLRTGDGLSAEERKKAEVERKLRAGTQRATTSERAEESRARREQQQQERAARRAAAQQPAAARNTQPAAAAAAQGTGAAQAAQGATQAATQAAASAQALTTQLTELQTQLQTQAAAMQEALSACASLAASQASVNAGVKSQLNALKNSIQRLQTRN